MNSYWNDRYVAGGNSGDGSYGEYAKHKADIINTIVDKYGVKTISDLGCGDGNQIKMLKGFEKYYGFDISDYIIKTCKTIFKDDHRYTFYEKIDDIPKSDLCLSLDVIYHIVDINDFENYMKILFDKSNRYVLIFSSNHDRNLKDSTHIYHRVFTDWVDENYPKFKLVDKIGNTLKTSAEFYLYELK